MSCYGAEAGNLALKTLPFGGLYIAGGIAPKLLWAIEKDHNFWHAFVSKVRTITLPHCDASSVETAHSRG